MSIETLLDETRMLRVKLDSLKTKLDEVRQKIAEARAVFPVGTLVTHDGSTAVWKITKIRPGYSDCEVQYIGVKIKKDGTPSTMHQEVFNFTDKPLRKVEG